MDYELIARVKSCSHVDGYIIRNCSTNKVIKLERDRVARFFTKNNLINGQIDTSRNLLTANKGFSTPCENKFCIRAYQKLCDEKYK